MDTATGIFFFIVVVIGSIFASRLGVPSLLKVLDFLGSAPPLLFVLGLFIALPFVIGLYFLAGIIAIVAFPIMYFLGISSSGSNSSGSSFSSNQPVREVTVQQTTVVGVAVTAVEVCGGCKKAINGATVYRCKKCGEECCWHEELGGVLGGGEGCMLRGNTVNPLAARVQDTCKNCGAKSNHPVSSNFDYVRTIKY